MKIVVLILLSVLSISCKSTEEIENTPRQVLPIRSTTSKPPITVYKTRSNYNNRVPVMLNEDKTQIIAYPDQKDIKVGGVFLLPTALQGGYLMDNKGIGENVAFLKYTYLEYARLQVLPSVEELYANILDKNPLTAWHVCKTMYKDSNSVEQLNHLINNGILHTQCD